MNQRSLVHNAEDEAQVRKAARVEERRQAEEREDLGFVLSTKSGRRVVRRWLDDLRAFEGVWNENPIVMSGWAAKQEVGIQLLQAIQASFPDAYLQMEKEHMEAMRMIPTDAEVAREKEQKESAGA